MRITVTLTDGHPRHVDKFSLATQVRFERQFGLRMGDLAPRVDDDGNTVHVGAGVEHVAWLAHTEFVRAQRTGRLSGIPEDFDAFLDLVEDFDLSTDDGEEGAGDPNLSLESVMPSDSSQ